MARPLRLELPGAAYHLTALGNGGQPVFRGAEDSLLFLEILGESCTRFDWRCFGYCLLPDRYHLVVETRQPTLARGMRQLNGRYTQAFNRRHGLGGHVFQGRYRAVMVESPGWLAAVRSEEPTSELPSIMRISYPVFCLTRKNTTTPTT